MLIEIGIAGAIVAAGVLYKVFKRKGNTGNARLFAVPPVDPIHHKFVWIKYLENVDDYGRSASKEYERNVKLHNLLMTTLQSKFSPNELTYNRYQGSVEQISSEFKAAICNILPVWEAIDLEASSAENVQRHAKLEQVKQVIDTCVSLNDGLDKLLIELSKLASHDQKINSDVEYLLKTLQDLTDRVKNYS